MARIPLGDFGQAVPQAGRTPTAGSVDGGVSQALQNLGNTAFNIGENRQNEEIAIAERGKAQQQAEERRREEKARQDAEREADKQARRAEQIASLNATADIQNGLADLGDEIGSGVASGQIAKTDARKAWTERSNKIIGDTVGKLSPDLAPLITAQMRGLSGRLTNALEDTIRKRDQSEADAGLVTYREQMQRFAGTDMPAAIDQWTKAVTAAGPGAGWSAEKIAKEVQGFKEQVHFTKAYEFVTAARNDRKGLDTAGKAISAMADMDPQRRATLMDRIESYKHRLDQQAELAAARAQRQSEAHLKRAEAVFQTFQGMADKGLALDPTYVDQVVKQTAGTPFQGGVVAIARQARENGGLAAQPLPEQRAQLDAINAQIAKEGNSPQLARRKDQIEKVLRGAQTDISADPLRAYLERSTDAAEFTPLDVSSMQGLTKSLTERLPVAARASQWSGGHVAPLTAEEVEPVRSLLSAMPAPQRAGAIAALATAIGPQASAGLAAQLDKKDRALGLAFGMAGAQTTQGRYVSELVIKGAQAAKDGTSTKNNGAADVKPAQWKRFMTTELEGVFPSQPLSDGTRDAAVYIAHGIAAENGGDLSEDDMTRAVRLAVGGAIVEHNGRRIPLPAGIDQDMLGKRLRSIQPAEIEQQAGQSVRAAGVEVPVAEFVKALPGAELTYAGPGRYNVIAGGRPVMSADGKRRIVIGVK